MMESGAKYWQLVRMDGSGRRRVEELEPARTFLHQQFADLMESANLSDATLQLKLLNFLKDLEGAEKVDVRNRDLAELCLRCFISHLAEQMCIRLEQQFGSHYGVTRYDLLPFVLDDDGQLRSQRRTLTQYRALATEILESFDPTKASLSTWALRLIRNHRDLNIFLRERGVYLASDWLILNDTSSEQAQKVLAKFHVLSHMEVEQAGYLLQAYHLVYRQDRLKLRQSGMVKGKEQYKPPTSDQLVRIAEYFRQLTTLSLFPESILNRLKILANQLRQYRVSLRSGSPPSQSLDDPKTRQVAIATPANQGEDQDEQNEFLRFYREQFFYCLDQALEQATSDRMIYLSRKSTQKAEQFVNALNLFHCKGQAMGEIAIQIGLKAQFEVTRLVKLKEFRASVRQRLLILLSDRILNKARAYTHSQQLHALDQRIEDALNEQIEGIMQQAEAEAIVIKHRPLESLFARRLCRYLEIRRSAL
jgi:hypothetical protein